MILSPPSFQTRDLGLYLLDTRYLFVHSVVYEVLLCPKTSVLPFPYDPDIPAAPPLHDRQPGTPLPSFEKCCSEQAD